MFYRNAGFGLLPYNNLTTDSEALPSIITLNHIPRPSHHVFDWLVASANEVIALQANLKDAVSLVRECNCQLEASHYNCKCWILVCVYSVTVLLLGMSQ